eukprot:3283612-Rhodomonas_salina.1
MFSWGKVGERPQYWYLGYTEVRVLGYRRVTRYPGINTRVRIDSLGRNSCSAVSGPIQLYPGTDLDEDPPLQNDSEPQCPAPPRTGPPLRVLLLLVVLLQVGPNNSSTVTRLARLEGVAR